jgi:hypothetical protein
VRITLTEVFAENVAGRARRGRLARARAASLGVTNIERSRRFSDAVLRPLGLVRIVDFGSGRGSDYGVAPGSPGAEFTITQEADVKTPIAGTHLCFLAPSREVDLFYSAALVGGWRDDGAPWGAAAISR